jgi:hypothetical protein
VDVPAFPIQFTVKVKVVDCEIDPAEAVTITVDVTGVCTLILFELHDEIRASPPQNRQSIAIRKVFLLLRPKVQKMSASMLKAIVGRKGRFRLAVCVPALTVSMAEVLPGSVTDAGLNEHDAPAGRPEQVKLTVELKPFCGANVSATDPWPPD